MGRMPLSKQTNKFQRLIAMLTELLGEGAEVHESWITPDPVSGQPREVDVIAVQNIAGHRAVVGIECRDRTDKPDVRWVEEAITKFQRLGVNVGVLVSVNGFTEPALKVAAANNIKTITPGAITEEFVGEIVNKLDSLWMERLEFTSEKATVVFDPRIGAIDRFELSPGTYGMSVRRADSTELCAVGHLLDYWLREIDISEKPWRDAVGEGNRFTITKSSPLADGQPLFLLAGEAGSPPTLRRITKIVIAVRGDVDGVEMPLEHGQYDGTNYSNGTAVVGDLSFHWVVTEGDEGKRMGTRIAPVDNPTSGQSYRSGEGTRMRRVD
jgi:hypothetical protein